MLSDRPRLSIAVGTVLVIFIGLQRLSPNDNIIESLEPAKQVDDGVLGSNGSDVRQDRSRGGGSAGELGSLFKDDLPEGTWWERQSPFEEVPKTIHWPNARLVLVTGLVESGYEPFRDAVHTLCGTGAELQCEAVCSGSSISLWFPELVRKHSTSERHLREELRKIRKKVEADSSHSTVYFLNLLSEQCGGGYDMQYPSSRKWGADTFPDVHWLAAVAEQERVDLRLVPLLLPGRTRTGKEFDMVARVREIARKRYATWESLSTAKALEGALQAMYSQLIAVDPGFFKGVVVEGEDPHAPGSWEQPGRLDDWLALPGLEAELRNHIPAFVARHKLVAEGLHDSKKGSPERDKGLYAYAAELKIARDQLESRVLGREPGMAPQSASEPFVVKRAISTPDNPRPKLLFFAGLEGTGHHLWYDVAITLMKREELFPACAISSILFQNHGRYTLWYARGAPDYVNATRKLRTRVNNLRIKDKGQGKVYLANLMQKRPWCGIHAGMMSYPNYESNFKAVQRPNLVTLARACEDAGVDLRVVALVRDSNRVIRSVSDHRSFGGGGRLGEALEMRYLTVNAHSMMAQLDALDLKFIVHCFDQDDSSLPRLNVLAKRTSLPTLADIVKESARFNSFVSDKKKIKESLQDKRRASMLFSMKAAEHRMRSFCPDPTIVW